MTDFASIILAWCAKKLVKVFGIVLFPYSVYLAAKQKRLNKYFYEVGRGWDILANKLYEPAFNKDLGADYGKDETISQNMARRKRNNKLTQTEKEWESRINIFDKNHLDKTKPNEKN